MKRQKKDISGFDHIIEYFGNYGTVGTPVAEFLERSISFLQVEKLKCIVEPGSSNENLFFIFKGVIRGYIKSGNKEITTWINEENELVGSIRNFGLNIPSEEFLQALEPTELIALPTQAVEELYEKFPETNLIGRKILEQSYRDAEERAFICRLPTAEERYRRFLQSRGSLLNRVPLKYIANYLGMKMETLSRIRSKLPGTLMQP